MPPPKRVFIGSAQADALHVDTLKKHLKLYERQNLIQIWEEGMLMAGEIRNSRIEQELHAAEIILLLFSVDLLAEDFIWGTEMSKILEKVKRKEVQLIPILLGPSSFADTHFSAYATVPQRDKPISNYNNKDEAWTIVVEQIKRSIQHTPTSSNTPLKPEPTMIPQTLIDEVNNFISSGHSTKALDAIIRWAHANNQSQLKSDATIIKSGLEKLKREEMLGMLSFSEASRESAKINHSLLNLLNMDLTPSEVSEPPIIQPAVVSSTSNHKLKILMMTANPAKTTQLNLGKEQLKIMEKLGDKKDQFELIVKKAIDKEDFKQYTEIEKPQILHFSGHGETGEYGGIVVQNEDRNGSALIPPNGIKTLFKYFTAEEIGIKVVVLNACYSKEQAEIISQYVPYVIGTTENIGDEFAIAFSTGFYFRLAQKGLDFEKAYDSGVTQASMAGAQEEHFILYKNGAKVEA
ncbi:CHAT domain-containing protein [Haliscomenobacter sp.]|uniref:CHAT domain-containing protein n=1 Tax=Haliscomenobacter sp. TaxID=2717303 RepID=UPI00359337B2